MGGNLFKLGRLPKAEYLLLEQELRQYLDERFGDHYRIPRYYTSKPDFGDMDIILSTAAVTGNWEQLKQEIIKDLGIEEHKSTGAVFSTVYKDFQVDYFIRPVKYFLPTYEFLCFNDLGNLIGKIFRRFNLKYGQEGLSYVFRREDEHYKKDLELSLDTKNIFSFIELDHARWEKGFDTFDDMFAWVIESPYFSVAPYEKFSTTTKKRVKLRKTVKAFVQYLQDHQITKRHEFHEDRDVYIPMIAASFPEANLLEAIQKEKEREAFVKVIKAKFNGNLIMQWIPGMEGKALGQFLNALHQSEGGKKSYEKKVHGMEKDSIERLVKGFYKDQYRDQ